MDNNARREFPITCSQFILGTDGIVECVDANGNVYGYVRVDTFLKEVNPGAMNDLMKLLAKYRSSQTRSRIPSSPQSK